MSWRSLYIRHGINGATLNSNPGIRMPPWLLGQQDSLWLH
jgi:hypothetical protein